MRRQRLGVLVVQPVDVARPPPVELGAQPARASPQLGEHPYGEALVVPEQRGEAGAPAAPGWPATRCAIAVGALDDARGRAW